MAWRARKLGIGRLYQGVANKCEALTHLLAATQLQAVDAGHMDDDWPDLPVMTTAGFTAYPTQAHAELRNRAHYVT